MCGSPLWDRTKDRTAPHDPHHHWHIHLLRADMDHQTSFPRTLYQSHHGVILESLAAHEIHIIKL